MHNSSNPVVSRKAAWISEFRYAFVCRSSADAHVVAVLQNELDDSGAAASVWSVAAICTAMYHSGRTVLLLGRLYRLFNRFRP